jgi:hypothetical protein
MLITFNYKDGDQCIDFAEVKEFMENKENPDEPQRTKVLHDYQGSSLNKFGDTPVIRTPGTLIKSRDLCFYPVKFNVFLLQTNHFSLPKAFAL